MEEFSTSQRQIESTSTAVPNRKYIGKVDGKDYETVVGPMPPKFEKVKSCHIDIWYPECRMWLATNKGQFYAPPFVHADGLYEKDDYRIFITKSLKDVFDTFTIEMAYLVDFQHAQIVEPKASNFGSVEKGESVVFSIDVRAKVIDLERLSQIRSAKRALKIKQRLARGGKKLRPKRKKRR